MVISVGYLSIISLKKGLKMIQIIQNDSQKINSCVYNIVHIIDKKRL